LTATVYRKGGGYTWRWTAWRGSGFIEAPTLFLTEAEAIGDSGRALPRARSEIAAQQKSRSTARFWWQERGNE
jgi:hypothetical protein